MIGAAETPLPRWLLRIGVPVVCGVLTLVFAVAQFPWNRLSAALEQQLGAWTGADVSVGRFGPALGWLGPWAEMEDVVLRYPDRTELAFSRARVRPAWALSWLKGEPALALDLEGDMGRLAGTAWPGEPAFAGRISEFNPVAVPPRLYGDRFPPVTGTVDADVDVAGLPTGGVAGTLELEARDGSLSLPDSPVAVPFTRLTGALEIDEAGAAALEGLHLEGPLVSLDARGAFTLLPDLDRAPLDLEVELTGVDPSLLPMLASGGLDLGPRGEGAFRISGTVGRPTVTRR